MSMPRTTPQLSRSSAQPLYMQVLDFLRVQLINGVWKPGDSLPPLNKLADSLGVARVTIRDAVKILCDEGLLQSQRGRGTIVTKRARGQRRHKLEMSFQALLASLQHDHPDVGNLDEGVATLDGRPTTGTLAQEYHYIKRVHLRDGLKYCVIDLYLDADVYRRIPERFQNELALPVLAELMYEQIARINQSVRFAKCNAEDSAFLSYPTGDPIAHVTREIIDDAGKTIYFANVAYRADILEIEMELEK
jgi:GntR family transcriptional regulator